MSDIDMQLAPQSKRLGPLCTFRNALQKSPPIWALTATLAALLSHQVHAQTDFCQVNDPASDLTASYCTQPNFPTYGTPSQALPANLSATLGDGLQLTSPSSNLFSLVLGSAQAGANITTGEAVRNAFYMNYISGDLSQTLGSPMDTGQGGNNTFAAVARHYNVGDPNDVHVMEPDGLHLRAICSQNHTACTPGNVYAGMIRVPAEIRPGMTVKVRYQSPTGPYSWAPVWMFSGSQLSPGPGGNPYQNFGTSTSLVQLPTSNDSFEIDLNDNYPRWSNNPSVPTGYQFDYGTPNIYGVSWQTPPHNLYWADGYGYTYQGAGVPPFDQLPINWSTGFHDLVLSWQTDNNLFEFVDGKLVAVSYMEYPANTYQNGYNSNVTQTLPMHIIIGNQAIPSFAPGGSGTTENDGIPEGWTMTVQEISAWNGNVWNPWTYQPAPNGCGTACQQPH